MIQLFASGMFGCVSFLAAPDPAQQLTPLPLYFIQMGDCLREFHGHSRGIASLKLSQDGNTMVSGSVDGTVRIWSTSSTDKSCKRVLRAHTSAVNVIALDESAVYTGSFDKTFREWKTGPT
jgi:WD40 repeat protein